MIFFIFYYYEIKECNKSHRSYQLRTFSDRNKMRYINLMNKLNLVNKEGFELERIYLDILQLPINIDSIEFINRLNISNVLNNLFSNITKTSKSFKKKYQI